MRLRFAPAAVAAAVFTAGCAYVSGPQPPLANVPAKVTDLSAVQRGGRIFVRFTIPRVTTENQLIRKPLEFDLRVGTDEAPFDAQRWLSHAKHVPGVVVENFVARCDIRAADWSGKDAILAVRVIGSNGKESDWSNFAVVPVVPGVMPPANVRAEATAEGVRVSWAGPGSRFRVFRKDPASDRFDEAATVTSHDWIDAGAAYDKEHVYRVQAVLDLGNDRIAESEASETVAITPIDKFPPATPTGLRATTAPNSVELSWEPNKESDFAAYRLYRAAPGAGFVKLGEDLSVPAYSDRTVEQGKVYRYAVTALDRSGNESAKSAPVEGSAQ